ncbi:hypothetical protein L873DRAFT_1716289 [Choiromyces venosus 120613-1]|uniref:GDS1 winged helix domain-containing protein n=1 Tax=Choiromyces venosus 120613-1 TaxID=1336337 RepID=A0A3N4J2W2_9PEZI|nr:hypothetical protein L873DRAFT_1716289 [Choiromyces venosus 120613-1]
MVYNTRRKSLSLPSLGIHLPQSSRSSPSSFTIKSEPPQKRVKRDHSPLSAGGYDTTSRNNLPPSPPPECRISHEGINDEIVSGVVDVLERSGNRPHTVKELAAVLAPVLEVVENSANPHAIISSRLNTYLKRPSSSSSSASSQCILSKELITIHPKRIYFYLSAIPHQPIPNSHPQRSVVSPTPTTPSTSDTEEPDVEENEDLCRRRELSPSPEVDLDFTSHELSPPSPVPSATSGTAAPSTSLSGSKSALSSPPLEGDEREFSQSAIYICRRSASRETSNPPSSVAGEKRSRGEYEADSHGEPGGDGILLGYPHAAVSSAVGGGVVTGAEEVLDNSSDLAAHVKRENGEDDVVEEEEEEEEEGVDIRESRVEQPRDEEVAAEVERAREESEKPAGLGLGNWSGELERHLGSPESVELDELDDLFDF